MFYRYIIEFRYGPPVPVRTVVLPVWPPGGLQMCQRLPAAFSPLHFRVLGRGHKLYTKKPRQYFLALGMALGGILVSRRKQVF